VSASKRSEKSECDAAALLEAKVDEAVATCGGDGRATLIANTYLEAEVERLTDALSTGFARGRMRQVPQRVKKARSHYD
jgi:hypothetical protein